jgi:serine/threonine-protein kinase
MIHHYTGIPPAGWGAAWAIIVLLLSIELAFLARKGNPVGDIVLALRIVTAVGAIVSLALLTYSIIIGVLCPTCFLFYLFVAAATFIAFRLENATTWRWRSALLQSFGLLLISFALLLYPGRHTPQLNNDLAPISAVTQISSSDTPRGEDPLAKFLVSLSPQAQQLVSDSLALYRAAPLIDHPVDNNRLISGTTLAPVHLIDWIDIRCPHCKHLEEALAEIRQTTPSDSWSEEGRHFPLDSECNPNIARSDGSHIACLAAKILICLGGSPKGHQVRTAYFDKQGRLTVDRIWDIAAADERQRHELESCVDSPETAAMLQDDIDLAMQYHISGTPLVVINGRQAPGYPPFIYAMIIAGGNINAEGFNILPPPRDQILDR